MPAAGILPASTDYVFLVKDTINGELKYTTSAGGTFVPYTGATQDVNLGEFGLQTGNVEFDNTPTNLPTGAGSMYYNDTDGTLDLILKGANVKLQIGQESVIRVVNKTATNINLLEANYQAVRVTGAQGQRLKVDLAQATSDSLSAETIGLVTETINNNQEGFITTSGLVRNINTTGSLQSETWADGDIVYLSPTTAGRITNVKPSAPNHLVIIGYVIYAHATQGSIFVKVDNGYELDELHNVKIVSPTNNQALIFNDTTDVWENKSLVTVSSYSKNATADSTILLLSDGTRYAAKDSVGGGGGGSAKAYTPLIVRNDSVYQRFNVLAYGADNTGTTDATVAIQAAINACDAAGGGEVYFPNGTYLIGGAINPTYNSQLYIPSGTTANRKPFVFMGESTTMTPFGGGLLLGAMTPPPTNGVILKSTLTTFTTAGQAVIGTVTSGINVNSITIKNIGIQVKHNPSGTGPVVGGINWSKGTNCLIENTYAVIDTAGYYSTEPQNNVTGIELPDNNISEFYTITNTAVGGFFNGYKLGEHTVINNTYAMVCKNAYFFKQGFHTSTAVRAGAYWNVNSIYVQDFVTLAPFKLDVEWQNIGKWYDNVYTIKDTANRAKGQLSYTIIAAGIGKDNTKFSKLGADSIYTMPDDNGMAGLRSNNYRSSGLLSQTFNQLSANANTNIKFQKQGVSKYTFGLDAGGANYNDFYIRDEAGNRNRFYMNAEYGDVRVGGNTSDAAKTGITLDTLGNVNFASSAFAWNAANRNLVINQNVSTDAISITGSNASRVSYVGQNTNSLGNTTFYFQNNRGSFASYGGIGHWGSTAPGNWFGATRADKTFVISDGASTTGLLIGTLTADPIVFGTSDVERMSILSGGAIGIGVTAPTAALHIKAGTATASTAPLKFTSGTNLTTPEAGAVEFDGTNYFVTSSTTRFTLAKTLVNTATLDFGNTAAGAATDLTITVTGAADGDAVSIGVPNGSTVANGSYTAWVSATNTVTIRFSNSNLVTALDPASGTFRAVVLKY